MNPFEGLARALKEVTRLRLEDECLSLSGVPVTHYLSITDEARAHLLNKLAVLAELRDKLYGIDTEVIDSLVDEEEVIIGVSPNPEGGYQFDYFLKSQYTTQKVKGNVPEGFVPIYERQLTGFHEELLLELVYESFHNTLRHRKTNNPAQAFKVVEKIVGTNQDS